MLDGRRVLAVVPARGGSKGVPLKNLHPLMGRPLISYTGDIVRAVGAIDRAVVSTDHPEIARVAQEAGIAAPFVRPEDLSGDRISDLAVLSHALVTMDELDAVHYDVVVMLQPTAPLRRAEDVDAVIRKLVTEGWDAVWTVSPTDLKYHPLKQLEVGADGALSYFDPRGARIIARQELKPVYHRNGAAYAFSRACLLEQKAILGARSAAVVVNEVMLSIDTLDDFEATEAELRARALTD
jgi:CMP-N,N'-diacetyllegionaminic acid synthase